MDVAVLHPQDCLKNPLRGKSTPRSNRSHQTNRRRRSPNSSPPKKPQGLVMGQVRILKRGETVETAAIKPDLNLDSTERRAPDSLEPELQIRVEKPILSGFYAGSAFVASPPPSSLPLPAFVKKSVASIVEDEASSHLRKILGINLI